MTYIVYLARTIGALVLLSLLIGYLIAWLVPIGMAVIAVGAAVSGARFVTR